MAAAVVLSGCGPATPEPLFSATWAQTYKEVRDCRKSGDHDLNYVRVLVDAAAESPYRRRDRPFAAGAVILKPEYADPACSDLAGYTVMRKTEAGAAPEALDFEWQRLDAARVVSPVDSKRCISCHRACGQPPDGHDGTCALP